MSHRLRLSQATPRGRHNSLARRALAAVLNASLLGGAVARASRHLAMHGTLRVSCYEARVERGLPAPLVIAFASDLHAGATTHPLIFEDLRREITVCQPHLLLLGGDFVSHRARDIAALCAPLAACTPPLGKFAVLGNHDLWTDDTHIVRELARCGVRVLVNENARLPAPFQEVSVCGMDDPWSGHVDAEATFDGAAAVRILLMHSPDGLQFLQDERFEVAFAGHTHGGQIAKADGTPLFYAGGPLSRQYCRGDFFLADHGRLIVSRGVGCSNLPIRINADPELVVYTLRPET